MFFKKKDRRLGVSDGKRRYDLPLNKGQGTGFLVLLIGLMTFLAILALTGSFSLKAMGERWSSGLENKLTIEIRAETPAGKILPASEIQEQAEEITAVLNRNQIVEKATLLGKPEIKELISPWLGEDVVLRDIPLPGLISVELKESTPDGLESIEKAIHAIAPNARLDTHESWLNDLLNLTGALQFATLAVTLIIAFTTIIAIAGGIRSRMALHKAEVELLHLMGAKDDYITKQFQRHAVILALQGSAIGTILGLLCVTTLWLFAGNSDGGVIPNLSLKPSEIAFLILTPALVCALSALTARVTVLRVLTRMP